MVKKIKFRNKRNYCEVLCGITLCHILMMLQFIDVVSVERV